MVRSHRHKYIRKGLRTCVFDFQIPEIELNPMSFRRNEAVFAFYSARRTQEELYDLEADPGELDNLIGDPAQSDVLARLRHALDDHLAATDDPFAQTVNPLLMPERDYERLQKRR
jgi:hypothetical protein